MNDFLMRSFEAKPNTQRGQEQIVLISSNHIFPRVCKIGGALRSMGFQVILLHPSRPFIYIPGMSDYFDERITFNSHEDVLEIARSYTPLVYHVFSVWNCDVAEFLIRNRPGKIVFDNYDLISGFFSPEFSHKNYPGLVAKEWYCLENADGVVCRSIELQHVRKQLQLKIKGKSILFLDYCWDEPLPNPIDQRNNEIHLVYAGSVILEKNYPPGTKHESFYLEFSRRITSAGIHFHLYPNPFRCNNFEHEYSDYFQLEAENPFFHMHHPLPSNQLGLELSQYDIGLMTSSKELIEQGTKEYSPARSQFGMPHKVFEYIDAGLGVVIGDGYDFSRRMLNRGGAGITAYIEDVQEKILSLPRGVLADLKKNARMMKSSYSVKAQIPRLIRFYFSLHDRAAYVSLSKQQDGAIKVPEVGLRLDPRVQNPYRRMSLVVDQTKGITEAMTQNATAKNETTPASNSKQVKISFVMIVLNGMPFVELALKNVYGFAHEIIVIEGAVQNCLFAANPDGSSRDGTVEAIKSFPDPAGKIRLIQGACAEKCEMQNKALENVTGDYIWLIDVDELYRNQDVEKVFRMLRDDPEITQINFIGDNFWKGFDYIFVSPKFFETPAHFRRVFKFKPGSHFTSHRPPTLVWPGTTKSTEEMKLVDGFTTRAMGLIPYHYSYVFNSQVEQKIELYRRYGWGEGWGVDLKKWYQEFFQRWTPENSSELERHFPIWTGDAGSYSVPFTRCHPEVVQDFLASNPSLAPVHRTTRLMMHHVIEAVRETLYAFILEPRISALETGTIRSYHEQHESTRHISQTLGNRGMLISVDMNPDSIHISRDICKNAGNVEWVLSDSLTYLKEANKHRFHFALLDSANDADIIFNEFVLVAPMMVENGILMVDDAGVRLDNRGFDETGAHKGQRIWQFLLACDVESEVLEAPNGHGTQVKIIFTPKNRRLIQEGLRRLALTKEKPKASFQPVHEMEEELITAYRAGEISERTEGRMQLYNRVRPESLVPGEYINVYLNLASKSLAVPGDILEVGVYRGGSLFRLAEHLEKNHLAAMSHKRLIGIDTFQGHPHSEPGVDPPHHPKGRFSDTSYQDVKRTMSLFPFVDVLMGDCAEIFTSFPAEQKFCLVNIDVDVKKSAVDALNYIYPRLTVGGAIIFDEFEGYGQEGYIKDFFRDKPVEMKPRTGRPGDDYGLIVIKRAESDIATLPATPDEQEALATKCSPPKKFRIAGEGVVGSDLTQIQDGSGFETSLRELVLSIKPRTIIETGTYLGNGTTRIIATALRDAGLVGTTFYSIECNPVHHRQACFNLDQAGLMPFVKPLLGLSVPRNLLPSVENILDDTVHNVMEDGIFVDHQEQDRVARYYHETDFPDIPEDLIGACLEQSGGRPDLVLLDSAGHMGGAEFDYVVGRLQGECYLVLDDIRHVKHYRSFQKLRKDPRFTVITSSDEKFGFCIAKFNPAARGEPTLERRWILWLRPDSIGDNILAMAMLPHLRARRPDVSIAVFCQEHIAELYEACPVVDKVITFNRVRALQDETYRAAILKQLQEIRADICLNTVYSREPLTDFFAAGSGARERIALMGDLSNTTAEYREAYNQFYTSILTSEGEHKPEVDRHQDFLRGIGITGERLKPSIWMLHDDIAFSDRFFKEQGFEPEKTIALFAGAQSGVRFYDKYGAGLAAFCREKGFSVVALGSAGDCGINQYNLDVIGVRTANLSGATTLRQSAAILSRCRLAVGAETGLAHMACAVGTPNVIVLGGGHFGRFIPYSPLTSVVCLPLECYGCNWSCRYERVHCVQDINHMVIAEAIRQAFAERSDKPRVFMQSASNYPPGAVVPRWSNVNKWFKNGSVTIIPVA